MGFSDRYAEIFKRLLPAPFTIAVCLTFLTFLLSFFLASQSTHDLNFALQLVSSWEQGLWEKNLIVFAFQMMLMLVLGHMLALTRPADALIRFTLQFCTSTAKAAYTVTLLTILVSLFNWGLGLIFGAVFARKMAEHSTKLGIPLNYPLIGACGYSGLMVWHGGISGSSLIKVSESGHLKELMSGVYNADQLTGLPDAVSFVQTVFSNMNLTVMLTLLLTIPMAMYFVGRSAKPESVSLIKSRQVETQLENIQGADKLNHSRFLSLIFGLLILVGIFLRMCANPNPSNLSFINPDFINLSLLFLVLVLHRNFDAMMAALDDAIGGAAGILLQFPLYFGIMGLMKGSGLVQDLSYFFISISTETTFPVFTFISAGIVNIFVPSGGGQWAVQGPIIIQTADLMHIPLSKCIMALAYGDQLTNMLQPFWALPLLGITGLKAKEILPYTLFIMVIGFAIFLSALLIF